jgi:hypothetical protein
VGESSKLNCAQLATFLGESMYLTAKNAIIVLKILIIIAHGWEIVSGKITIVIFSYF